MSRPINPDKLLRWIKGSEEVAGIQNTEFDQGVLFICNELRKAIQSGELEVKPPIGPQFKLGDRVKHKDYQHYGEGTVTKISDTSKRAKVKFNVNLYGWVPEAYYRFDKLILIE
ncbi:hypothetical protein YDYSY3_38370 [Paenibacillus chitinolyticus]|uniref:hypothetical protein n=1 Tax=Paenibacillus chitinolyticus TaxID=79263 RepID=UPI0026E4C874|nr:hypothetical protein [Paenibacillus chitinolyticus]GKS12837.1 hypothetical protein YDYSY3_38370 [Paenibacillus chitinolyticus]